MDTILTILIVIAVLILILQLLIFLKPKKDDSLKEELLKLENLFLNRTDSLLNQFNAASQEVVKSQALFFNTFKDSLLGDFSRVKSEVNETLLNVSKSLEEKFEKLQGLNEAKLNEIRENVEKRLAENIEKNFSGFKEMTEKLGDLKATNDRIVEISKDINQLQTILASPKMRGNFGEFALENMLSQIIPKEHYTTQYQVSGNNMVDAVIHLKEGLLCIDSKFPLANFTRLQDGSLSEEEKKPIQKDFFRDVKKHIDDISLKYIVPEKTLDFAMMFIPAENVYYEILMNSELHNYSLGKKVIPVSPNNLYALLQTFAIGFRGMKIGEESKRIAEVILALKKNFELFKDDFRLIGKHLDNAKAKFISADTDVQRFDTTISGLQIGEVKKMEED